MEKADNASLTEVRTLTIDCEQEETDRRIIHSNHGKDDYHNTLVCQAT